MERKELLAVSMICIVISLIVSYAVTSTIEPAVESMAVPMEARKIFAEGFDLGRQLSPVDSLPLGYRIVQENYSIVTVGATSDNSSEQSASITSKVTRETTHIILIIVFQPNSAGNALQLWTKASLKGKLSITAPVASVNVTQQITLPFSYSTDGKVYWQMPNVPSTNSKCTIYLWGYFERGTGTVK